jgi:hypothetical protein
MEMKIEKLECVNDNIKDYHSKDCISASGLKLIYKRSIFHYLNKEFKKTSAMDLGNAAHILLYEGLEKFGEEYFVLPKLDMRKKDDKELKKDLEFRNKGKKSISNDQYKILMNLYTNLDNNKDALFFTKGKYEISHYGTYEGIPVRVRPDCMGEDWISDIKTCQDSSPREFKNTIWKFSYMVQAVFYCDMLGYDPKKFRFIACETNAPYTVQHYALSEDMIKVGRDGWKKAFHYWKQYVQENKITYFEGYDKTLDNAIII